MPGNGETVRFVAYLLDQMLALVILLANPSDFSFWVLMGYALLLVSAGLTLWSMVQYLRAAWPHLKTDVEKK